MYLVPFKSPLFFGCTTAKYVWSLIVYAIGADVGLAPLTNTWLGSKSISIV
jgi:hypothetical protein